MTITLAELLASGQPQVVIAAIKQHPDLQTDRTFSRLFISLQSDVNRYNSDSVAGTSSTEKIELRSRQLMARIEQLVDYQSIHEFAVEKSSLPEVSTSSRTAESDLILFLASNPKGMLQMEREYTKVSYALQDEKDKFGIKLSPETTRENVRAELLKHQPKFIHFSGHGVGEGNHFRDAGLVFQSAESRNKSETMPASEAAAMFELLHQQFPLKLVLLNACESAAHAKEISNGGFYAVGMTVEIKDHKAIAFAEGFYHGLAATPDDISYAFKQGVGRLPEADQSVPKLYLKGEDITHR